MFRFLHILSQSIPRLCSILLFVCYHKLEYHFFCDPSPKNDQRPAGNIFANKDTNVALAMHSRSLSSDLHMMSLNIDMKISRPLNCDGSPILVMNSWTLMMSCNVVDPGKIFHSNSIGSPSIVSKVLYCGESLNHVNLSSQSVFDCGFSFIFSKLQDGDCDLFVLSQ